MAESVALADSDRGVLEPYQDGLIEVRPIDEPCRYRWILMAVYLANGDAYQPSCGGFATHLAALRFGKTVFDWIMANPKKINCWGCPDTGKRREGGLGISLHRQQREFPSCPMPYFRFLPVTYYDGTSEPPRLEVSLNFGRNPKAAAAGWAEAIKLPYYLDNRTHALIADCYAEDNPDGYQGGWASA